MATESIRVEGTPLCSVFFSAKEKNAVVDPFRVVLTPALTNLTCHALPHLCICVYMPVCVCVSCFLLWAESACREEITSYDAVGPSDGLS